MGRATLVAAVALAVTLLAPVAQAYRFAGPRWPNQTIAVANEVPRYETAVRKAMRAWNRADVGVRFVRASTERARVVFRPARGGGSGHLGCEGIAGGTAAGYPSPFLRLDARVVPTCRSGALRLLTAAHELGHVLGLGHENRRCALMNSTGNLRTLLPSRCRRGTRLARGLIRPDDRRGARALYRRPPPAVDPGVALFSPGPGSRLPWTPAPLRFSAALVNPALDYAWNFGDPASDTANVAAGPQADHAFSAPGSYRVTLRVSDGGTPIAEAAGVLDLLQ